MRAYRLFIALCFAASLQACARGGETYDPLEPLNRFSFATSQKVDRYLLVPMAKAYRYLPDSVERGVENFTDNLGEPLTLVNDILQFEFGRAGQTLLRFGLNSTIGLGGIFNPAGAFGLPRHSEDFGQTFGAWGAEAGAYIFIPVLGPSSTRDLLGFGGDREFTALWLEEAFPDSGWETPLIIYGIDGIAARAGALELLDEIERDSIDYYASIRSLYLQNRKSEIANGEVDLDALPDLDDFEDFDAPADF